MLKITSVNSGSIAHELELQSGDYLVSINDNEINDFLDYRYYSGDELLKVLIHSGEEDFLIEIEKDYDEDLGLQFEPIEIKPCGNNCIFCFIKQNPKAMRKAIYFCDEDYRYSFLCGNFITLTNITEKELQRIADQRMSPLYISVHTTDPIIRKKIFRNKSDDHLMEKMGFLQKHKIQLHTQIVLMPGINDKAVLEKTVKDLYGFRESVKSVAIVPVGLTKHRKKLEKIDPVGRVCAEETIDQTHYWNKNYHNTDGDYFVNIADEFFLLADQEIPENKYYGQYHQIENGIGLTRDFIEEFERQTKEFPKSINSNKKILLITGTLAKPILEKYIIRGLKKIQNLEVNVVSVINNFYGKSVTVSGLITGQDIISQMQNLPTKYDAAFLPPRCINNDGVLLDDKTPGDISEKLDIPVYETTYNFLEIINNVAK